MRTRLITLTVALVLLSCLAVAAAGLFIAQRAIQQQAMDQLTAVREIRAAAIEDYFAELHAQVATLSRNPEVIDAARDLTRAFDAVPTAAPSDEAAAELRDFYAALPLDLASDATDPDPLAGVLPSDPRAFNLQHLYLAVNPHPVGEKDALADAPAAPEPYRTAHAHHHAPLRDLQQLFGYYDVFLVAPDATQAVVYSVYKETDFATSLTQGPHAASGLAEAARRTLELDPANPDATVSTDFAAYGPSYGAPAAFLGSPVVDDTGRVLAAFVVQAPASRINAVMTGNRRWREAGLGESGETYLVGADRRMRSDSRFFLEDPDGFDRVLADAGVDAATREGIKRYGTTNLQQEVDSAAANAALAGETGTAIVTDYRGIPVLSSYRPLDLPGRQWAILSEIDEAEAFVPVATYRRTAVAVTAGALGLAALAAALLASHFVAPILKLARVAHRVGGGDYTARADDTRKDEIGELGARFNDMVQRIETAQADLRVQNLENERLLQNILPTPIAQRLRGGEAMIADKFPDVAVLFGDIVGFTTMAADMDPTRLVGILDEVFTRFDDAAARLGIEKIKTIGDEYMAVCGLPHETEDHVGRALQMSLAMLQVVRDYNAEHGLNLAIRVGVHHGPVVAGIIGKSKFIYDLWGDTVNTAARMQSTGVPGRVHVTADVRTTLADRHTFEARGTVQVKGKGEMQTFLVEATPPA